MGMYEDRQIHTKTSSRPVKSQDNGPALILIECHLIKSLYNVEDMAIQTLEEL